jgi:hypothetical protein
MAAQHEARGEAGHAAWWWARLRAAAEASVLVPDDPELAEVLAQARATADRAAAADRPVAPPPDLPAGF